MIKLTNFVRILSVLIIFSFLLPVIKFGGVGFKPDLLFLIVAISIIPFINQNRLTGSMQVLKRLKITAFLIFLVMVLSNSLGISVRKAEFVFSFPTEFIQVFSRVAVFYLFSLIGYYNIIKYKTFIKLVSVVLFIGLVWGVVQSLGIGIINRISLTYAISDVQEHGFSSSKFRGFGTAGNILTWGGLSILCFHYFFFIERNRFIKIIGCVLAVYNVILTASRSSLVALVVSFLIVQLLRTFLVDKKFYLFFKRVIFSLLLLTIAFYAFTSFMPERYELIQDRFLSAESDITEEGRGAQTNLFMGILNSDNLNYLFGMGKPTVDSISYLEIEPFYILACYGITGLVLHYWLVILIVRYSLKLKEVDINIFLFSLASTFGFLIFSLGFFFLREAHSGLPFWWLNGYFMGFLYKNRDLKTNFGNKSFISENRSTIL